MSSQSVNSRFWNRFMQSADVRGEDNRIILKAAEISCKWHLDVEHLMPFSFEVTLLLLLERRDEHLQ